MEVVNDRALSLSDRPFWKGCGQGIWLDGNASADPISHRGEYLAMQLDGKILGSD
jgi:hypothetical protein